jgi:hypothetical protein
MSISHTVRSVFVLVVLAAGCGGKSSTSQGSLISPSTTLGQTAGSGSAALSGEGEPCSDDVAVQKKCQPGLTCVMPTTGPISEHTPGTCQKPKP